MASAPVSGRALRSMMLLFAMAATAGLPAQGSSDPVNESAGNAARLMNELMSGRAAVGGPFTLTDTLGQRRGLAEFRGQIVLLYFGYTQCPDTCPADLAQITDALTRLGEAGKAVQPIFVTLDPDRDTPAVLREYAAAFHPRLIALRGTAAETRAVAESYKVAFRRVAVEGSSGYVVDHSTFTFVIDREGRYVAFFPPGTPAARMEVMLRGLLQQ